VYMSINLRNAVGLAGEIHVFRLVEGERTARPLPPMLDLPPKHLACSLGEVCDDDDGCDFCVKVPGTSN